jgi:hypothetical protein
MSEPIQLPPISPVPARTVAIKRVDPPAAPMAAGVDASRAQTARDASEAPVQPVAAVEPGTYLTIAKDEVANTFVYRSIDEQTGEVVWQYPLEQMLRMAHRLRELESADEHRIDEKV